MRQYYTLEMLEDFYRCQETGLSEKVIEEKAKNVKRALNTLDIGWARSNHRFYAHNQFRNIFQSFN